MEVEETKGGGEGAWGTKGSSCEASSGRTGQRDHRGGTRAVDGPGGRQLGASPGPPAQGQRTRQANRQGQGQGRGGTGRREPRRGEERRKGRGEGEQREPSTAGGPQAPLGSRSL